MQLNLDQSCFLFLILELSFFVLISPSSACRSLACLMISPSSSSDRVEELSAVGKQVVDDNRRSDILEVATQYAENDQLLESARLLRRAALSGDLQPEHQRILEVADRVEGTILDLHSSPDLTVWTKLRGIHDGKRDILVHYKLDDKRRLTSRIEFLVPKPLVVPMLAVLIESELYNTWVPRFHFPPVGIKQVTKIAQTGRTKQYLHANFDIPWKRDVVIASTGVDDVDEDGLWGIYLEGLEAGQEIGDTGALIPPPEPRVKRIEFQGCFVFHKCPEDHPLGRHLARADERYEEMFLVGFTMFVDAKLSPVFPQWIVNFIIKIAMVRLFRIFISVAEEIQSGKRPDHTKAIERKRNEIYDWIHKRVGTLL